MSTYKVSCAFKHGPYFGFVRIDWQQRCIHLYLTNSDNIFMKIEDIVDMRLRNACDEVLNVLESPMSAVTRSLIAGNHASVSFHVKIVAA